MEGLLSPGVKKMRFCFNLILLLCALVACVGCASPDPAIQFRAARTGQIYSQQFGKAIFARVDGGEYNVVLSSAATHAHSDSSGPIESAPSDPLTQTVFIRILWKPLTGIRLDAPSTTNAVIDWRVRGNDPSAGAYLHYRGAGFVSVYDSGETSRFVIRRANVELSASGGQLQDPLGTSSLSGTFEAVRDDGVVAAAMAALRDDATRRTAQSAGYAGPPPRNPAGP
jgi:hypothetical protein